MSKVRVILKPGGFIIAAFIVMIITIIGVFLVATQPEVFQRLIGARSTPSPVGTPGTAPVGGQTPTPAAPAQATQTTAGTSKVPATAKTLTEWLVLSPIPAGFQFTGDTDKQRVQMSTLLARVDVPNEGELAPNANDTVSVKGKTLRWEAKKSDNFLDIAPPKTEGAIREHAVGYAVTYVDQPKAVDKATLYVGSDDSVVVWLNGKEIWRNPAVRGCVPGDDVIRNLSLKQGRNVLVFKVGQGYTDWSVTAALETN